MTADPTHVWVYHVCITSRVVYIIIDVENKQIKITAINWEKNTTSAQWEIEADAYLKQQSLEKSPNLSVIQSVSVWAANKSEGS